MNEAEKIEEDRGLDINEYAHLFYIPPAFRQLNNAELFVKLRFAIHRGRALNLSLPRIAKIWAESPTADPSGWGEVHYWMLPDKSAYLEYTYHARPIGAYERMPIFNWRLIYPDLTIVREADIHCPRPFREKNTNSALTDLLNTYFGGQPGAYFTPKKL